MPLSPNSAALAYLASQAGMPRLQLPDGRTLDQPHPEWLLHQLRWRWLLDSWEGGEAYRMAVYGFDIHGMPVRNLIRHKREYPSSFDANYSPQTGRPAGTDQASQATDDDLRAEAGAHARAHLRRRGGRGPPGADLQPRGPPRGPRPACRPGGGTWTARATSMDQWMSGTIAPLLLVLGQLDIIIDHPPVPEGEEIRSRADEVRLGLDTCVASYILPENLVWWTLDRLGGYDECLVREVQDDGQVRWRYWDARVWALFDQAGKPLGGPVEHPFGRVPIVRLFDRRRPRCRNIGLPRYESIAELQREYYNRDSELILSDTTQAHPLLQGPEDYVQADGTVPIGPNWLLPKKKNSNGAGTTYEGFDVVAVPQGGGRLDPPEQGRPARCRRPRGAAAQAGRAGGAHGARPWPRAASPSGWTRPPATTC